MRQTLLIPMLLVLVPAACAQALPDRPRNHVVDLANLIEPGLERQLIRFLAELEQKTSAQMIVLTLQSTGDRDIRQFSIETAEQWELGQKGRDNGALIVVAIGDRQWNIEVGYGLEPVLTDGFCGRVGRQVFVPHFKRGQYGRGLYEGTLVLANQVAAEAGVQISGMPTRNMARPAGRGGFGVPCFVIIIAFIVLSSMFGGGVRRGRYRRRVGGNWLMWLLIGNLLGGRRTWGGGYSGSSWGSGSGFGSGFGGGFGGGSFGGGGGGGFGGGGASGGW